MTPTERTKTVQCGTGEPLFNLYVEPMPDFHYPGVVQFDLVEGLQYCYDLMAIDLVYDQIDDLRVFVPWVW